jgi:hypothetical protein
MSTHTDPTLAPDSTSADPTSAPGSVTSNLFPVFGPRWGQTEPIQPIGLATSAWLTAHGVVVAGDSLRVTREWAQALSALTPSGQLEVLADLCQLRAGVRRDACRDADLLWTPPLPPDLRLPHNVDRLASGRTLAVLHAAGARAISDLVGPDAPELPVARTPSVRRALAVQIAVERWGAAYFRAAAASARARDGFDVPLHEFDEDDAAWVSLGLTLAQRGFAHVRAQPDGRGVDFSFPHPDHELGRAWMAWARARPEGAGVA